MTHLKLIEGLIYLLSSDRVTDGTEWTCGWYQAAVDWIM